MPYNIGFCCTTLTSYMYTTVYSSWAPLPLLPPTPSLPLGHHRALSWVPCAIQHLPPSYFTHGGVFLSILLSQFVLPSPSSLCLQVCSLHLYSCPANRLVHQVLLYFTWGFVQSFPLCLEYLLWFFSIPARLAYLLLSNTFVISPQSLGTGYLSAWTVPPPCLHVACPSFHCLH